MKLGNEMKEDIENKMIKKVGDTLFKIATRFPQSKKQEHELKNKTNRTRKSNKKNSKNNEE